MSDPTTTGARGLWVAPVTADDAAWLSACQRIEREAFDHAQLDLAAELRQPHASLWVAGVAAGPDDAPSPEASPVAADAGSHGVPGAPEAGNQATPGAFVLVWYLADEVEIQTVATAPAGRRRGLGRALVERALAAARERGCGRALLEVRAGNVAARGLYGSLGFQEDGVRRRYYSDPTEDAVLMSRPLETP
ncbi:MAG: GNAT family N-acetyltransferase [Myxococcales bacterium]|nr:MAG: GNAT family N-acetyltransferase [Myxococcales bacterium]